MKVAVISDTHYGDKTRNLPTFLFEHLRKIQPELILHAGDVTSPELLEKLEEIAPTLAVRGNVDRLNLPEEEVVEVEDVKIGMIHGHQLLSLNAHFLTLKALEMDVDVLVFGHTHRYYYDIHSLYGKKVILLNPGSPVFPRMDSPGFAVLKVSGENVGVERITFW
ncbi:metallophosphoesterase [Thermococcus peptonophilus]|uniref:Phosphoesterase n=1 Tax=Thermococcus peptonophilus TaxID=53952 RepID=A0A142CUD1_9EURY|nr:metallophosphoesterase [Thermococcus peptonophilus]AMQ18383.1 3',5'-cyclic-nucleotide phosphodiesterase [Thermococcus peptonophilus]